MILTYVGLAIVPILPRRAILVIASVLGSVAFHTSRKARRVGMSNLDIAFGKEFPMSEKLGILRKSYQTFSLVMLDIFWFSRRSEARIRKYVEFDASCAATLRTRPAVSITGHIGNWEIIAHAVALQDPPFTAVAAPLKNSGVDRVLNRIRRQGIQRVAYKQGAMRAAIKTLREGGRIGLLLDQNIMPAEGGKFVEFFGLPAPISAAAEKLAVKTNMPITFMFCAPRSDGTYLLHSPPPLLPDSEAQEAGITQTIAKIFETEVTTNPGYWLWMYKRWKYIPPGEDAARYPFYSRAINETEGQDGEDI